MNKIRIIATALFAVSVLATGSIAQGDLNQNNKPHARTGQNRPMNNRPEQGRMDELRLSQDQIPQIQSIVRKFHEGVKGINQSSASREVKRTQIASLRKSAAGEINAILTPEQQAKITQMSLINILENHPRMKMASNLYSQLNLTDAQKAQIKAINQSTQAKVKAIREDSEKQISALLTPEQLQKLNELKNKDLPKEESDELSIFDTQP